MTGETAASISSAFGLLSDFTSSEVVLGHPTPAQCMQPEEKQLSFKRLKCFALGFPQVVFCGCIHVSSAGSTVHPWGTVQARFCTIPAPGHGAGLLVVSHMSMPRSICFWSQATNPKVQVTPVRQIKTGCRKTDNSLTRAVVVLH